MFESYKNNKLLPCPFCGGEAEIGHYISNTTEKHKYYVGCSEDECCEIDKTFNTEEEAVNAWNRRSEKDVKIELLNQFLGKNVTITLFDGTILKGTLQFCAKFCKEHGYRKPNYYYIENTSFKASHVTKVEG